jgi:hypothetical protein
VLHEVKIAKAITAKEMVFNMALFPFELLVELILRVARIQRWAGRGGINHGSMLPERSPGCQYAVLGIL